MIKKLGSLVCTLALTSCVGVKPRPEPIVVPQPYGLSYFEFGHLTPVDEGSFLKPYCVVSWRADDVNGDGKVDQIWMGSYFEGVEPFDGKTFCTVFVDNDFDGLMDFYADDFADENGLPGADGIMDNGQLNVTRDGKKIPMDELVSILKSETQ